MNKRQWDRIIGLVFVAGLLFIGFTRVTPAMPVDGPALAALEAAPIVGHSAPDFTLTDLSGAQVTLSALGGQVVLINIWATWCPPCRAEMPMIQAAYERYRNQGFVVLAVNQREAAQAVKEYMEAGGFTFPALLDSDGQVSGVYRASLLPSSFFIDRNGVVRAVYRGPMARSVIAGVVEQLLGEQ